VFRPTKQAGTPSFLFSSTGDMCRTTPVRQSGGVIRILNPCEKWSSEMKRIY
jgi:hypothetical protein